MTGHYLRNSYVEPDKDYDKDFKLTDEYIASLPDLQDGDIKGAAVYIPHVGIHNFHLPLKIKTRDGSHINVEASITGTVSLEAEKKGINMSRIIRTFYEHSETVFSLKIMEDVLKDIADKSEAFGATIFVKFRYPIKVPALRTEGLAGWQYYDVGFKLTLDKDSEGGYAYVTNEIEFDFTYSSACPCSYELAEHARANRNKAVVSHSQRSVARLQLKLNDDYPHIWIEEIQELCVAALHTETQVMVKRPDEQAFAELNGSHTKFVEDAARQLWDQLYTRKDLLDFRIVCSHLESLHSHDAIAIMTKYNYYDNALCLDPGMVGERYQPRLDYYELRSMVK